MRTEGSGGFQGAISSMLSVADICPSCGKLLGEHQRKILLATTARCPDSLQMGAFPYIEGGLSAGLFGDDTSSPSPLPPAPRYAAPPRETAAGVFAAPAPEGRLVRRQELLTMVWSLGTPAEEFP